MRATTTPSRTPNATAAVITAVPTFGPDAMHGSARNTTRGLGRGHAPHRHQDPTDSRAPPPTTRQHRHRHGGQRQAEHDQQRQHRGRQPGDHAASRVAQSHQVIPAGQVTTDDPRSRRAPRGWSARAPPERTRSPSTVPGRASSRRASRRRRSQQHPTYPVRVTARAPDPHWAAVPMVRKTPRAAEAPAAGPGPGRAPGTTTAASARAVRKNHPTATRRPSTAPAR